MRNDPALAPARIFMSPRLIVLSIMFDLLSGFRQIGSAYVGSQTQGSI